MRAYSPIWLCTPIWLVLPTKQNGLIPDVQSIDQMETTHYRTHRVLYGGGIEGWREGWGGRERERLGRERKRDVGEGEKEGGWGGRERGKFGREWEDRRGEEMS